jgi:hypothetical protein
MSKTAYIQTASIRTDGTKDSFCTISADLKIAPLWWQEKGLQETATGYGKRLTTQYQVRFNGKWRRVYCVQYSNIGTLYIGKLSDNLIVNIH